MDSFLLRAGVLSVLLLAAVLVAVARRRTDGRARAVTGGLRVTPGELGGPLGDRATLLQFSAPVCAPCRAAHRVLSAAAQTEPGVAHVELEAGEHLDLVRRLGVLRTPTVVVLTADGRVAARAAGVPNRVQVARALELALAGRVESGGVEEVAA